MKFCSLYSGSSGNCLFLEDNNTKILIDGGVSGKKIVENLKQIDVKPEEIDALLITHDHIDHTRGVGILSRRYNIPIYSNQGTWDIASKSLGKIAADNCIIFKSNNELCINGLSIMPFLIHHDAGEPVGFSITNGKQKIGIITDTGEVTEGILSNLQECDLVMIESNHDVQMLKVGRYPYYLKKRILSKIGHLSNEDAAEIILRLVNEGLNKVILAHLSEENNFPELAFETTSSLLTQNNIKVQKDVVLEVASRFNPSTLFSF
ncbi:MBL fold metallo-hydrolase [Alkalibaculum sp. M08DMB]|uniref:MBL fold metallo-hydrolase n=1 Tax=Alkalibaculum sporogenes TaxID=2655001 RepID=A0A6A7K730_9FIRM|nr:MBL fold metallo-hydrolase [Alkalibaculum sporogenes]MPW25278.1 MBL fold metallo-hydrolase [Alkalibaculum sporogenes]